jgi:hypothetical protein
MATAITASLPSSSPVMLRTDTITQYPVMNLNNIFSQQFSQSPPPTLTQLESLALEPLDDSATISNNSSQNYEPIEQAKLRELKSLIHEFNYKMFSMPPSVDTAQINLVTDTLNAIIDSPVQSSSAIYRPPQATWVPLFETFFKAMEQLPDGVEMRELAIDIEIAFTSILGAIEDGEIDYVQYTVIMFTNS